METLPPNHHADHPGFSGWAGLKAAVRFLKVSSDAAVACDLTNVSAGDHVVDIGSGPGVAVRQAVDRGATATAVDPAQVMLDVGRKRNDHANITWRIGTAESIPVSDAEASVVWSVATVHHWKDIDAGLDEVTRILAPGGRFLAVERHLKGDGTDPTDHGWLRYQAERFMDRCVAHGFDNVRLSTAIGSRGDLLCVMAETAPRAESGSR